MYDKLGEIVLYTERLTTEIYMYTLYIQCMYNIGECTKFYFTRPNSVILIFERGSDLLREIKQKKSH